jgi:hypothetical protein
MSDTKTGEASTDHRPLTSSERVSNEIVLVFFAGDQQARRA